MPLTADEEGEFVPYPCSFFLLNTRVPPSFRSSRSGEFHTYRAHRRKEMHRVAAMDDEAKTEEATAKLQAAIEQVCFALLAKGHVMLSSRLWGGCCLYPLNAR